MPVIPEFAGWTWVGQMSGIHRGGCNGLSVIKKFSVQTPSSSPLLKGEGSYIKYPPLIPPTIGGELKRSNLLTHETHCWIRKSR